MPIKTIHLPSDSQQQVLTQELARFQQIPGALNLEQLDGYFTALHLSPTDYDIADWLELIWGGGDLPVGGLFYSIDEIQQFFTTMIQHWHNVRTRLEEDELFMPLTFITRNDASYWAQGFLLGTKLYEETWQEYCETDEQGIATALLAQAYLHHKDKDLKTYQTEEEQQEHTADLNQQLIITLNHFIKN
ncbi:MAG: YecA family protein [Cellvibrionaceae bacterium]|nr:YecA family protein [Cellvibrionaceae bacterium]